MDLKTKYMGLELKSPLVPSASPLSQHVDNVRAMEDAGASAVVLFSLFEEELLHEQRELDYYLVRDAESYGEATSYFPDIDSFKTGPDGYLEHIRKVKEAVDIPVIASLNGVSTGGWVKFANKIEQAGADAVELNVYFIPTDAQMVGTEVEQLYLDILADVKRAVKIPVAMKLSPYFSSLANMATRLGDAGADGLVLFNRFYQPDLDIEKLEVLPTVTLSTSSSTRLPMRWLAILRGIVKSSLAASSGVHTHEDVLKMLMVGADVTMMTSALLQHGIGHLKTVHQGLVRWMEEHEYASVEQMKGSMSRKSYAAPAAFERANYMKALQSLG
jgi:dihydroorotate dehydrogenase (fumarate)